MLRLSGLWSEPGDQVVTDQQAGAVRNVLAPRTGALCMLSARWIAYSGRALKDLFNTLA